MTRNWNVPRIGKDWARDMRMFPSEVRRLVTAFGCEINWNGFELFFANMNDAAATVSALDAIGALETAQIVKRAWRKYSDLSRLSPRKKNAYLNELGISSYRTAFDEEDMDFATMGKIEDLKMLLDDYEAKFPDEFRRRPGE